MIDGAKKYVVSSTLDQVDWNAELVQGDLEEAVKQLKQEPGEGLYVGGVTLPLALADLGLIDEYEFFVQPILAGHGPTLFAGLREPLGWSLWSARNSGRGSVAPLPAPSSGLRSRRPWQAPVGGADPSAGVVRRPCDGSRAR